MTDREFAVQTLVQARDILGERLIERLIDSREQVLEDAIGGVFEGEIDSIHEQIGSRLSQVNQMLANLPDERVVPAEFDGDPDQDQDLDSEASPTSASVIRNKSPLAVETLRHCVETGDLQGATKFLSSIFAISYASAERCAEFFFERCSVESDTLEQTRRLLDAVGKAHTNDALVVLSSCFGLSGDDLIQSYESLESGRKSAGRNS